MGKSKKKNSTNTKSSSSVKVVTAGGAGSPGRNGNHNKDPRRNKPRPPVEDDRNDILTVGHDNKVATAAAPTTPSKTVQSDELTSDTSEWLLEIAKISYLS